MEWMTKQFPCDCDMYLLTSMLDAMPLVWRNLSNGSKSSIAHLTSPFEPNPFNILYENDIIPLYNKFVSKVCTKPTARKKCEESFNTEESQGAFVWDQSGIRIIGIMQVSVHLAALPTPEYLDFFLEYLDIPEYILIPEYSQTNAPSIRLGKNYLLPIRATLSTKLLESQYKILNRILYTNDMLFKFKKIESPLCYFCEMI